MLEIQNLQVYYGVIAAVRGIDMQIDPNTIVTLIGSNGAGKTSTLNAIVNGVKKSGTVIFDGKDISNLPTHRIIQDGIALVPEASGVRWPRPSTLMLRAMSLMCLIRWRWSLVR